MTDIFNEPPTADELKFAQATPTGSSPVDISGIYDEAPTEMEIMEAQPVSMGETAIRAVGQGLTGGFHDEMAAGLGSVMAGNFPGSDDYTDEYRKQRDYMRRRMELSREEHPGVWNSLNLVSAFLGAGKVLKAGKAIAGAGKAAQAADTLHKASKLKQIAKGTGALASYGAVDALGLSEADLTEGEYAEAAEDMMEGAAFSLGTAGVLKGGAGGLKQLAKMPKKLIRSISGVPEEHINRFLANPTAVEAARPIDEIADSIVNKMEELRESVWKSSKEALNLLPEEQLIDVKPVLAVFNKHIKKLATSDITDESVKGAKELLRMKKRFEALGAFQSLKSLKPIVQGIDRSLEKSSKANLWMTPSHIAKTDVRKAIDLELKAWSTDYANAMLDVAKRTETLKGAAMLFGDHNSAIRRLKGLGFREKELWKEKNALKQFDEMMGTRFLEENRSRVTKEIFDKDMTRGSRGVNLGTVIGGVGGFAAGGIPGAMAGAATGATIGATVIDKYGGQITRAGLKNYKSISPLIESTGKYGALLRDKASQSESSLAATHFLLMQSDEEYRKKVRKATEK